MGGLTGIFIWSTLTSYVHHVCVCVVCVCVCVLLRVHALYNVSCMYEIFHP